MKYLALLAALAALTVGAASAQAKELTDTKTALKALGTIAAAELPAAATRVVMDAPKESRPAVIDAVMRKVAKSHPVALRHVVAAIAKADGSLAALAAGMAAKVSPESVGAIAAAACTAAPEKASHILAVCSRVTVASRSALAEMVSKSNPAFSAELLTRESERVDVTSEADVITGGTVITPVGPQPGSIGYGFDGEPIFLPPQNAGPGVPGFDPDRYAAAGS